MGSQRTSNWYWEARDRMMLKRILSKTLSFLKSDYKYQKSPELNRSEGAAAFGAFLAFTECIYTRPTALKLITKRTQEEKVKFNDSAKMRVLALEELRKLTDSDPIKRAVFTELMAIADHSEREYELMSAAVIGPVGKMTKNKMVDISIKERMEVIYIGFCRCLDEELEVFF